MILALPMGPKYDQRAGNDRDQAIRGIEAGIAMAEELEGKRRSGLRNQGEMGIEILPPAGGSSLCFGKPVEDRPDVVPD